MTPMTMSTQLAEAHRQDLLREAQRANLASEITPERIPERSGIWTAALLLIADLLLDSGQRLRAHIAHKRLKRAYEALHTIDDICGCDETLCGHIVSVDV